MAFVRRSVPHSPSLSACSLCSSLFRNEDFSWEGLEFDSVLRVELKHRLKKQQEKKLDQKTVCFLDCSIGGLMQAVVDEGSGGLVELKLEGEKGSASVAVLLAFDPNGRFRRFVSSLERRG